MAQYDTNLSLFFNVQKRRKKTPDSAFTLLGVQIYQSYIDFKI